MQRIALALIVAAAACKGELNPEFCAAHPDDPRCTAAAAGDAHLGGSVDGNDANAAATCLGRDALKVCLRTAPTAPVDLNGQAITTSGTTNSLCATSQPIDWLADGQRPACFIVGTDITLEGTVTLRGDRPVVFVATGSITVNATLAASAQRTNNFVPAGFDAAAADCPVPEVVPTMSASGGGGGAGGALGGRGGNGGAGQNGANPGGRSGAPAITILHGGCVGQDGANNGTAMTGGIGGYGGGGVYLVAGGNISFGASASIDANGAAGRGGNAMAGGGGGGSGGMIILWAGGALELGANVVLWANGGGGASGSTNQLGKDGSDPVAPLVPAPGGSFGGAASGGAGAAGTMDPGAGAGNTSAAGGGGGGSSGIIYSNHALTAATVSPVSRAIN